MCRAHWGQKVVWGASCNRVCVFVCELGGRGSRGSAPKRFFFFFFVAGFSCWSLWLSDSGAQWHFLIGFPSHPLVASALAQQSQGHNHSCAGLPRDTAHTPHAYKLYAHYLVSLQLLISNYRCNLAPTEPRGTHTQIWVTVNFVRSRFSLRSFTASIASSQYDGAEVTDPYHCCYEFTGEKSNMFVRRIFLKPLFVGAVENSHSSSTGITES